MISVLIITCGRPELLQKCLASLEVWASKTEMEVLVIMNGHSSLPKNFSRPWLRFEEIPKIPPGAARNYGWPKLKGEWTFFMDDDVVIPPGYLEKWQSFIAKNPQAQVVGGPDAPMPEQKNWARALSLALSSPMCSGLTSKRHYGEDEAPTHGSESILSSCNLWVKTAWREKVEFHGDYRRGEETVLLNDIAKLTPHVWWVPDLQVWHARREDLKAQVKASYWGGYHRARFINEHGGPKWFWLSVLFVLLHLTVFFSPTTFIALAGIWALLVCMVTLKRCQNAESMELFLHVGFLHWIILFSYGLGFMRFQVDRK